MAVDPYGIESFEFRSSGGGRGSCRASSILPSVLSVDSSSVASKLIVFTVTVDAGTAPRLLPLAWLVTLLPGQAHDERFVGHDHPGRTPS